MQEWQAITTGAAVAVAVASLLVLVGQRTRRDAEIVFAVVSGSMALSLMSPWMDGAPAWMRWAVAIGGTHVCATTTSGGLRCWGDDYAGSLGIGRDTLGAVPRRVVRQDVIFANGIE